MISVTIKIKTGMLFHPIQSLSLVSTVATERCCVSPIRPKESAEMRRYTDHGSAGITRSLVRLSCVINPSIPSQALAFSVSELFCDLEHPATKKPDSIWKAKPTYGWGQLGIYGTEYNPDSVTFRPQRRKQGVGSELAAKITLNLSQAIWVGKPSIPPRLLLILGAMDNGGKP